MDIVRDHDLAGRHQRANFFRGETFILGDFGHLPGDYLLAGGFNLRHRVPSAAGRTFRPSIFLV